MAAGLTQVLAETTNGTQNASTITYLYGLGLVAQSMNGVAEYNLTDGLGSVRQLTNAGGQVLLSQTFDPYGNRYETSRGDVLWDAASPFGWTGEQSDPSGLTYLRARYYAPSMGRFTQIDPFGGALALPASMNGYGYGHGNPVRYTDPSGEFVLTGLALAAAIVFIAGGTAFTIDYTMQYAENRALGMDVWQSLAYYNHDWKRTFGRTGEAMLMTTVGLAAGWAIGAAGLTGAAAWTLGAAVDVGFGTGWDMAVHGGTFGESLFWNAAFFGIGEGIGYGLKDAAKGLGKGIAPLEGMDRLARAGMADDTIDDLLPDPALVRRMRAARATEANWIEQLVARRRIVRPEGMELTTDRIFEMRRYLHGRGVSGTKLYREGNINILEADNMWYLGFSEKLDEAVRHRIPRTTPTPDVHYRGWEQGHSESNALNELWHRMRMNRQVVRSSKGLMVGTKYPCRAACVTNTSTMRGQVQAGMFATGFDDLRLEFIIANDVWPNGMIETMWP